MKNLKHVLFLAALPVAMALNVNAQVKPATALKIDTALLKKQLKPQPQVTFLQHDFAAAASSLTPAPVSVVKTTVAVTPKFQFKSSVVINQPGSIHPTPLSSTTFQPVMITSPGGTVSSINSQGIIVKKN